MPVLEQIKLNLDIDHVLRGMGTIPQLMRQKRQNIVDAAQWGLDQGIPLLNPRVAYNRLKIAELRHERLRLENDYLLTGKLIAQHLGPAEEVIAIVCTIGAELEEVVSEIILDEPLKGLALDGVGTAAVEALANEVCVSFEQDENRSGRETSLPLSPGMLGWDVQVGQTQIFTIVNAELIQVSLTESCMMLPVKSLSMVVGVGRGLGEKGRTCDYCAFNETCRYQDHYSN